MRNWKLNKLQCLLLPLLQFLRIHTCKNRLNMNDDSISHLFNTISNCPIVRRFSVVRNEAEQLFDALIDSHDDASCPLDALLDRIDANRDQPLHLLKALAFVDLASASIHEDAQFLREALIGGGAATRHRRHRLRSACNAIERSNPPWCDDFTLDNWMQVLIESPNAIGVIRRAVECAANAAELTRLAQAHFSSVETLFVALPRSVTLSDREFRLFDRLWRGQLRAALLRRIGLECATMTSFCDNGVQSDAILFLWHTLLRHAFDERVFLDDGSVVERVSAELLVSSDNLMFSEALLAWFASVLEREQGRKLLEKAPQLVEAATRVVVACASHSVLLERRRMRSALRFCLRALRLRVDERSLQFCFEQLTTTIGLLRADESDEAVAHLEILGDVLAGAADPASALGQPVCVALFVIVDSLTLTSDVIAVAPHALADRWLHAVAALWDSAGEHCFAEYAADALDEGVATLSKQLIECVVKYPSAAFECFTSLSYQERCLPSLLRAKVPLALCDVTQAACVRLHGTPSDSGVAVENGRVAVNAAITMTSIVGAATDSAAIGESVAVGVIRRMADVLQTVDVNALGLARASRLLEEWLETVAVLCKLFAARLDVVAVPMWANGMFRAWSEFVCGVGARAFEDDGGKPERFVACVCNLARIVNALQLAASVSNGATGASARESANAAALARVVNERLLASRARLASIAAAHGDNDTVRQGCEEVFAFSEMILRRMQGDAVWRNAMQ